MKQTKLKKLTIIGGSGFFGKSFIDAFNFGLFKKIGIKKLVIISRNPNKLKKEKELGLLNVKLIKGDTKFLKNLPESDFYIYAGEPSEIKKYNNSKMVKNYNLAIDNFFEKIIKKKKSIKILYISSGSLHKKKYNKNYKNYNLVKKYSEKKFKQLSNLGYRSSIARCYTFIGKWIPLNQHYAIGNFISDGFEKSKINLLADKQTYRSYMYSEDLIRWLLKILIKTNKNFQIFNVGSDQKIGIVELANRISMIFKKKVNQKNKINNNKTDNYLPSLIETKKKLKVKINYDLNKALLLTINQIYEKKN